MEHPSGATADKPLRLRSSTVSVSVAALAVAASGYLVLVVAARALGPAQYFEFSVFWAGLYLAVGSVFGVQQETTRTVREALTSREHGGRPLHASLLIGASLALAIAVSAPFWSDHVFGDRSPLFVTLIAGGVVLYAGHATLAGALGALDRWGPYAALLASEAMGRLALVLIAAAYASLELLALASVLAIGAWLVFVSRKGARKALSLRGDGNLRTISLRMSQALLAAVASATLVTGFPIMLSLTASDFDPELLAVVVLVVTLTRAPIMVPLNAFLGMILAHFIDRKSAGVASLATPVALVLAGSIVLGLLAAWVGNPLLVWFFGEAYRSEPWFIGTATGAAGFMGVLTVTGGFVLSRRRHGLYLLGWFGAAAVTVALLLVPLELELRVVLALTLGPVMGAVVHCAGAAPVWHRWRAPRDAAEYH